MTMPSGTCLSLIFSSLVVDGESFSSLLVYLTCKSRHRTDVACITLDLELLDLGERFLALGPADEDVGAKNAIVYRICDVSGA